MISEFGGSSFEKFLHRRKISPTATSPITTEKINDSIFTNLELKSILNLFSINILSLLNVM
jgi:hypothetical protein